MPEDSPTGLLDETVERLAPAEPSLVLRLARQATLPAVGCPADGPVALTAGAGLDVQVGRIYRPLDELRGSRKLRRHALLDVNSFALFVNKYSGPDSAVYVCDDACVFVHKDPVEAGDEETGALLLRPSAEWNVWSSALNSARHHRPFFELCRSMSHTLVNLDLLNQVRKISVRAEIKSDSAIEDTSATVGVVFKADGSEQLAKFPKEFEISLPVLDMDLTDEDAHETASLRLDIVMPTNSSEEVAFVLRCPTWPAILRKRVDGVLNTIQTLLGDTGCATPVYRGKPAWAAQRLRAPYEIN